MLVLTMLSSLSFLAFRGLYGGYVQFRSTLQGSSIGSSLLKEQEVIGCYEKAAAVAAGAAGFTGSVEVSEDKCNENAASAFAASRNKYKEETSHQEIVGGSRPMRYDFYSSAKGSVTLTGSDGRRPADHSLSDGSPGGFISTGFYNSFSSLYVSSSSGQGLAAGYDLNGCYCTCLSSRESPEVAPRTFGCVSDTMPLVIPCSSHYPNLLAKFIGQLPSCCCTRRISLPDSTKRPCDLT